MDGANPVISNELSPKNELERLEQECNRRPLGHPTVKPLSLCRYLATLLLPPGEYAPRRLLVPFAGTGSEMIGGLLAGWDEVVGIEMETEYCTLAEKRIAYWLQAGNGVLDDVAARAAHEEMREQERQGQLRLL